MASDTGRQGEHLERWAAGLRQVDERALSSDEQRLVGQARTGLRRQLRRAGLELSLSMGAGLIAGHGIGPELVVPGAEMSSQLAALVLGLVFGLLFATFACSFAEVIRPASSVASWFTRLVFASFLLGWPVVLAKQHLPKLAGDLGSGAILVGFLALCGVGFAALRARLRELRLGTARLRALADDLLTGRVACFERHFAAHDSGEDDSLDILPASGLVIRAGAAPCIEDARFVPVQELDIGAARGPDRPLEGALTIDGVAIRQRALSAHERAELGRHARRELWSLLGGTLLMLFCVAAAVRAVERGVLDGPEVGFGWRGLTVTLLLVGLIVRQPLHAHLELRRDLRGGVVLVARRGDAQGEKLEEALPASRRAWTQLGTPAQWRRGALARR